MGQDMGRGFFIVSRATLALLAALLVPKPPGALSTQDGSQHQQGARLLLHDSVHRTAGFCGASTAPDVLTQHITAYCITCRLTDTAAGMPLWLL